MTSVLSLSGGEGFGWRVNWKLTGCDLGWPHFLCNSGPLVFLCEGQSRLALDG